MNDLYIMLTEFCPNNCEYCYIKEKSNPKSISFDTIVESIEKYNPIRVIFFGGEPLMELKLIEKTMEKYYGKVKFQIVTSATANYREYIETIYKKYPLNELQVSWDGIYNYNRKRRDGSDISKQVFDNILWTISKGIPFDIKCVISEKNVMDMKTIHNKFKTFKKDNVSGQFVIAHRNDYSNSFFIELEEGIRSTMDLTKMHTDYLDKIIAFIQKDKNFSSCDIGKYVVINPSGKEFYCTAMSQYDYNISSQSLQERSTSRKCLSCEYNYMCDGGCRYERIVEYGNNWKSNYLESTCKVMQIYNRVISDFISRCDQKKLLTLIESYKNHKRDYYTRLGG